MFVTSPKAWVPKTAKKAAIFHSCSFDFLGFLIIGIGIGTGTVDLFTTYSTIIYSLPILPLFYLFYSVATEWLSMKLHQLVLQVIEGRSQKNGSHACKTRMVGLPKWTGLQNH